MENQNWLVLFCVVLGLGILVTAKSASAQEDLARRVQIVEVEDAIEVRIGDELFTRYLKKNETKPAFFPVLGPGQISMTRSYPLAKVEGEANDHPHHQSLWMGHEINGLDFWANKDGVIRIAELVGINGEETGFTVNNEWVRRKSGEVVCQVTNQFTFGADERARWLDARVTFHATDADVTFNDTKEGMFAIRTHPNLRLKPVSKGSSVGQAVNSEGVEGKAIWGKPARWVNYWGEVDEKAVGVAIFDHPDNLRHPTRWHARDYGLVAANPFGLHHFAGAEKGDGEYTIQKGDSLTFKYRMVFHLGEHNQAMLEEYYQDFAETHRE